MSTPTVPTPPAPAAKAPASTHDKIISGASAVKTAVPAGGKPSTGRSVLGGAAGGAATGATLGSVFPGVGTVAGAAGGAVVGGAGGALKAQSGKRAARAARRAALGPARTVLVGEFIVCITILALSPLTDKHKTEGPQAFMRRGAATCALFFILALVSSGGRGATKVAAAFGGIVTLSLLVSSRDVFTVLAQKFASSKDGPAGPEEAGADIGSAVSGIGLGADIGNLGADVGQLLNPPPSAGPLGNGIR